MLIGAAAFASASDSTESESELLNDITEIFATQLEIASLLPLVLLAGLLIASLGVLSRA